MQLRLPLVHRGNRLVAVIVGGVLVVALYLLPSRLQLWPAITLDRSFIDAWVPFLGWTIWVYLSEYPLMVLAIWLGTDDRERSRLFYSFILVAMIGAGDLRSVADGGGAGVAGVRRRDRPAVALALQRGHAG